MSMKRQRIMIDVTDPNNVFVHKGGRRKGHTYIRFRVQISDSPVYWASWRPGSLPHQRGYFMVPQS
jgi:hypothetical protein